MGAAAADPRTARLNAPAWRLIGRALGGPRAWAGKLRRVGQTLRIWASPAQVEGRLARLHGAGVTRAAPSRLQLAFGGVDMLRFLIAPGARDYAEQLGISFGFHQLLRVLDDPVSMIDPTGLVSARETIAGHLMQVVHLNPIYDLQLLEAHDDGLADLERQLEGMLAGRHPRSGTIGAIVEDASYHGRLLVYLRRYRLDRRAAPPVREPQPLRAEPHFAAAERALATLPGFLAYCEALPRDLRGLLPRLWRVRDFPLAQAPGDPGGAAARERVSR
jgi:hypothetical protein